MSSTLDLYEFRMSLFDNVNKGDFFVCEELQHNSSGIWEAGDGI